MSTTITSDSDRARVRPQGKAWFDRGGALFRVLIGAILLQALAAPLAAQTRLYVLESGDKYHSVLKVSGGRPYIMSDGKVVAASGQRFALRKVDEYLPVFITVLDKDQMSAGFQLVDVGANTQVSRKFHFSAKFEAAYVLEDVFLVLEVDFPGANKSIFVNEIGKLEPRTPKPFSVDLPLEGNLGPGQIKLHLFVGGSEVLQSEQTEAYRAEMLDRMIARRVAALKQADPKPFYGSVPGYPAAWRETGTRGEAVVTMRVSPQGVVLDPVVESASAPAFGEEALVTVRQWRFLPRVQDGRAVETTVRIPFVFNPPNASVAEKN